jgi:hypothetical protein
MKIQLLLLVSIATLFFQCKSKKNSENVKVSIELTVKNDYCGGAAPSEEMLKEMNDSKPFINSKFYLVLKNEAGVVIAETEQTTDENGKLSLNIKKGMYEIYQNSIDQRKKLIENIDEKFRSCSSIYYEQPQAFLHAWTKGPQKIEMHLKCNPCLPPAP